MSAARPDRKYCSGACQSQANRRKRGEVAENTGNCVSCLTPLTGKQANATLCGTRKCMNWAARHPGVPHPSTQPRTCEQCGVSIDHRNGKAKYCGRDCSNAASAEKCRDDRNAKRREEWADGSLRKVTDQRYRKANAEKYREYNRKYRAQAPARYRQYYAKWLSSPENYQRVLLNNHTRRVRIRENPDSVGVSIRDWLRLVRRYRGCCAYCGVAVERPVVDHVVPVSRGGRHAIGNVVPACDACNASKHNSFVMEWRRRVGLATVA